MGDEQESGPSRKTSDQGTALTIKILDPGCKYIMRQYGNDCSLYLKKKPK